MPESETLKIIIQLRDEARRNLQALEKQLGNIDRTAKKTSTTLATMRGGLGKISRAVFSLKSAFAALGIGLLARSFVDAASTAEQYRTRLKVLLGSVAEGNRLFANMAEFASTVSFQYEEIMGAATNLAGVMRGGTDEITAMMPLISDLAAASGLSIQDTTSQIIRMYSAGAASADMFRERGVLAMLGFQAGVSVSAEETMKQVVEAWEDPQSRFRGAATELANTWGGMMSMLSDLWFQFRNMVMEAGVFDFIKASAATLLDFFRRLKEEGRLKEWAEEMASAVVKGLKLIAQTVAVGMDAWWGLQMVWETLKIGFGSFASFVNLGLLKIGEAILWVVEQIQGMTSEMKKTGEVLAFVPGFKSIGAAMIEAADGAEDWRKSLEASNEQAQKSVKFWEEIVEESKAELLVLAREESSLTKVNRVLDRITKKAAEFRKEAEAAGEAPLVRPELIPEASLEATLKSSLARGAAIAATQVAQLESIYNQGLISFGEYWDKREQLTNERFERELAAMNQLAERETDPSKRLKLLDQVFAKEQEFERATIKLADERSKALMDMDKARTDIARQQIDQRIQLAEEGQAMLSEIFVLENEQMTALHEQEIQDLISQKATMAQIEEQYRIQQIEREQQSANQRKSINELVNASIQGTLGNLSDAFGDAYDASGQKAKEFFYAQKAIAIVQTAISTWQAAQAVYASASQIPIVGWILAPIAAAAAVAAGLARVAAIRNQSLAEGGPVKGKSPHSKADNIPAMLTADEFVHPVDTVRYYGKQAMEAIRRRLIPKEALAGFNFARVPSPSYNFQTGGAVAAARGSAARGRPAVPTGAGGEEGGQQPININNIIDPQMMDQYVASKPGQRNVMNVMSQNAFALKQIILGEG